MSVFDFLECVNSTIKTEREYKVTLVALDVSIFTAFVFQIIILEARLRFLLSLREALFGLRHESFEMSVIQFFENKI